MTASDLSLAPSEPEPHSYTTTGREHPLPILVHPQPAGSDRPVVLLIHGGGWHTGTPEAMLPIASAISDAGYVAASAAYRLVGEAAWPAALQDVHAAVDWIRQNAAKLGAAADAVIVAGGSAGGHLAAMTALAPAIPGNSKIAGACLFNPVLDLRRHGPGGAAAALAATLLLGPQASADQVAMASPLAHLHPGAPPFSIRVGDRDEFTPPVVCEAFHAELQALGVPTWLEVVPNLVHGLPLLDPQGCADATLGLLAALGH